jgi:hypothetical protein
VAVAAGDAGFRLEGLVHRWWIGLQLIFIAADYT